MEYRRYKDSDYLMICDWFKSLDWPILPRESIPEYGVIITEDDKPVASSFIYLVYEKNCDFIYPGWILFNPESSYKTIMKSIDFIAKTYEIIAKENGKTHIQTTLKTESLINRLCKNHGYHKAETNVTRVLKYIDPSKKENGIFWYDQTGIDHYFPESPFATPKDK